MGESDAKAILALICERRTKERRESEVYDRKTSYWAEDVVEFSKKVKPVFDKDETEDDETSAETVLDMIRCSAKGKKYNIYISNDALLEEVKKSKELSMTTSNLHTMFNAIINAISDKSEFDKCSHLRIDNMRKDAKIVLMNLWEEFYEVCPRTFYESCITAVNEFYHHYLKRKEDARTDYINTFLSDIRVVLDELRQENVREQTGDPNISYERITTQELDWYEERITELEEENEKLKKQNQLHIDAAVKYQEKRLLESCAIKIYKPKQVRDDEAYDKAMGIIE